MLIGAEGAKTPAGVRSRRDPAGALAPRRLPATPAESEAPGAQINKQFNKDIKKTPGKPKVFRICRQSESASEEALFFFMNKPMYGIMFSV